MTETKAAAKTDAGSVVQLTRDGQLAQLSALLQSIPEAEGASDGLDVALRLTMASDWQDLNLSDSGLPQSKDLVGRTVNVHKIERHESTKDGPVSWFFVVDSDDVRDGQPLRFSTGAPAIMVQLAMLHAMGKLPAVVTIKSVATRSGNDALQLVIESVH